ncbi:MAG: aryl-sulfate sulfotransferase [Deltaproteobacteria bacterium]|nr:aryl-sulfate sulfotransferase [Deltaproteobacteria bacterium]
MKHLRHGMNLNLIALFVVLCTGVVGCEYAEHNVRDDNVLNVDKGKWEKGLKMYSTGAFEGYTLFSPMKSNTTYLIDMFGRVVHTWESNFKPGLSVYLCENGNLLRTARVSNQRFGGTGGAGGRVQKFTWDGELVWDYGLDSDRYFQHHDIEQLPNGNVLMIAWEYKTYKEAVAAGRKPGLLGGGGLWPDVIIEVKPVGKTGGEIIWEWHMWDHVVQDNDPAKANYGVVKDHPELLDINYASSRGPGRRGGDWNHVNSVDYNEKLDQIVISLHNMSEIYIIDHSISIQEAAGHTGGRSGKGGDILYRWGNPQVYRAGGPADQKLFAQHDAMWVEEGCPGEGNITIFNNGQGRRDGAYSSIDEITPPVDGKGNYSLTQGSAYAPAECTWIYTAERKTAFYADHISGASRLPNGNTIICSGTNGTLFEVIPEGKTVWKYVNPFKGSVFQAQKGRGSENANSVFKVYRYASDYAGLAGRDLTRKK